MGYFEQFFKIWIKCFKIPNHFLFYKKIYKISYMIKKSVYFPKNNIFREADSLSLDITISFSFYVKNYESRIIIKNNLCGIK